MIDLERQHQRLHYICSIGNQFSGQLTRFIKKSEQFNQIDITSDIVVTL